jgi:hypothetical protein
MHWFTNDFDSVPGLVGHVVHLTTNEGQEDDDDEEGQGDKDDQHPGSL